MKEDLLLKLQAKLDGETLTRQEEQELEHWLATEPEAREWQAELCATREMLRANEPACPLPVRGDFYWQGIQTAIERDAVPNSSVAPARSSWLSWAYKLVVPAGAAIILGLLMVPVVKHPGSVAGTAGNYASFNVESSMPDATVVTFRSEQEGVTVVWMDTK